MADLPVTFYYPSSNAWRKFHEIRANRNSFAWTVQENWIAQTYLYLHDAGYLVSLSDSLPSVGILVFSPLSRFALRRAYIPGVHGKLILVSTRADLLPSYAADFEVLQNGRYADGRRRFFIPHWPQPGLIRRDPIRGNGIKTAAYVGNPTNLDPAFRSDSWRQFLSDNGIEWRMSEEPKLLGKYDDVDLLLAVRRRAKTSRYSNKPASKLVNAWTAGVPALLGPEYAFRELRRSDLDYLEVRSVQDAMEAVRRLLDDPSTYRAMVQNGQSRSEEFSPERLTTLWADLLFETIPRLYRPSHRSIRNKTSLRIRGAAGFISQPNFGGYPHRLLFGKLFRWAAKRARCLLSANTAARHAMRQSRVKAKQSHSLARSTGAGTPAIRHQSTEALDAHG